MIPTLARRPGFQGEVQALALALGHAMVSQMEFLGWSAARFQMAWWKFGITKTHEK